MADPISAIRSTSRLDARAARRADPDGASDWILGGSPLSQNRALARLSEQSDLKYLMDRRLYV